VLKQQSRFSKIFRGRPRTPGPLQRERKIKGRGGRGGINSRASGARPPTMFFLKVALVLELVLEYKFQVLVLARTMNARTHIRVQDLSHWFSFFVFLTFYSYFKLRRHCSNQCNVNSILFILLGALCARAAPGF
jgi:hypothetical protein